MSLRDGGSINEYRTELRDVMAQAALESCKANGDRVLYRDRTEPYVELWTIPAPEERVIVNEGAVAEEHTTRRFSIPRQKGRCNCEQEHNRDPHEPGLLFPPSNEPSIYAEIRYEGHDWSVSSFKRDAVGAMYVLECIRHQPRRTARV